MKQILQSYKTGDLWLADVPVPMCRSNGVVIQTRNSFVSAGTERMLVDFAKKNLAGKALAMPDQVKKVLRKMKTEGIFSTLEKVQAKLDQPIPLGYSCAGVVAEAGTSVAGLCAGDRVMGFDPDVSRCRLALDLGADRAVSSDLKAACNDFSRGYGVDAVLITAAARSNEPVTLAGEISRMKGKVVVTGLVGMDLPRDMYYKKELDFKLSLSYGPGRYDPSYEEGGQDYPYGYVRWTEQRNIQAFLDMVASGAVTPSKLVTHRFDIDDALNAYELILGARGQACVIVVVWSFKLADSPSTGLTPEFGN